MSKVSAQRETIGSNTWNEETRQRVDRNFEIIFSILAGFDPDIPIPDGAEGDLLIGGKDGQFERLAKSANATRSLCNTGTNNRPKWDQVSLETGVQDLLLPSLLDVTGSPAANVILYGDRWDSPPSSPFDLTQNGAMAWIARTSNIYGIGIANGTFTGSGGTAVHQANNLFSRHLTAAAAGSGAGWYQTLTSGQFRHDPTLWVVLRTGPTDITNIRFWIGLTHASAFIDADDMAALQHYAAFRYSTVAGDSGWVGATKDGTTQNVTSTVASIAANTEYLLKIRLTSTACYFSVNGGTEVASSSNLPTTTTEHRVSCIMFSQEAVAKEWAFSRALMTYGS